MTLTFDLLTPISIGVFYLIRAITLWSLKALGQKVLELLSGNEFQSSGNCDLDLWPTDPNIKRVFYLIRAITLWSMNALGQKVLKLLRGKRSMTDGLTDRRTRQKQYVSPRGGVTVTLTFDLLTPISIGVFYSIRAITLWSMKALGHKVLKLLSGNEVWQTDWRTDGQMDRRTRQKQYVSPRGGGRHNESNKDV